VLYHYPETDRPGGRDVSEIEATKTAGQVGVPVFVITLANGNSQRRDVRLGWVEDWDDGHKHFLITFSEEPVQLRAGESDDQSLFQLVTGKESNKREVDVRQGQPRFKFRVFQRYGSHCAVCDLDIPSVLDAAHLCPKKEGGTDDPRNGLVLCALHHRALDSRLFAINPQTFAIHFASDGPSAEKLGVIHRSLAQLPKKPHREALGWLWKRWQDSSGEPP